MVSTLGPTATADVLAPRAGGVAAAHPPVPRAARLRPGARRWHVPWRLVSPVVLLVLWQVGSATGVIPPDVLPSPGAIVAAGWQLVESGELQEALLVSTRRVLLGLVVGGGIGLALGVAVGFSKIADALLDPPLQMLRALPHLGLIPLFILWFGIGEQPKILLVGLGVAFPLYLTTSSGIRQVDPKLLEAARVLGFSFSRTLRTVILPSAAPQILVGLRQSFAIAWLSLIVAEQINSDAGLGFVINNAREFFRTDTVIFGLVVYALLGLLTDWLVRVLERRALRYRESA
ncbi:ABC transporter permease [Luteimicrobium subarcticum]|uniref:Sulfonate transport system permease protein n=1 Tax=Luteimicrobium subarcticum TaxID=620910 RepID=A0A2M8WVN0_9MICO|nr:ABC transporter permease [Luteimicrobium subarcticum]PJI94956.1 sulfonate transport system permease protein [Luteimicrobium subarcticum]